MRTIRLLLAWLVVLASPLVHAASATVDRARLTESETLELRIRLDGADGDEAPDLAPLGGDFEVLSNSRNSRISLINGQGEMFTEWVVRLAPRRAGELEIPALAVGAERTAPIRVVVVADDASQHPPGTREIELEVVPEAQEVHVQQQLLLTVRLLHAVDLANGATLEEPALDGAIVRKLGENSFEKRIGGRRYGVFERRYAVFPQASGELRIPPLRFEASVGAASWFDRFGSDSRHLRLRSREQRIRVLPPEAGATPWLPARLVTLVETWDRSPHELRAGESTTRTLTLTANGLTAAQLPALPAITVDGLRLYPDQADIEDAIRDDGLTGTRTERSAVIPLRAGEMQLPEIRLRWWDTINGRFQDAVVPGRTIRVQPAAGADAADDPALDSGSLPVKPDSAALAAPAPSTADTVALRAWQLASLALALLAALLAWLWRRALHGRPLSMARAPQAAANEAERYAALHAACLHGDAAAVPELLLLWFEALLAPHAPRTLAEGVDRLAHGRLREQLEALAASRYSRSPGEWHGAALCATLDSIRADRLAARDRARDQGLPPLYPERGSAARS